MDPIRTLIADDYPFFRRALKAHLEENCIAVVVGMAANGPDAVAFAEDLAPDLVLMKIHLPGLDELEACRKIRAQTPDMKIIVYIPYGSEVYAHCPEFCADACMAQDALFDELSLTIARLIPEGNRPLKRSIL
jgi:DNA-binding NarL/FixJ family response regulator